MVNYKIDVGECEDIIFQIPYEMLKKITKIVENTHDYLGEKKYGSRKHFIIVACQKLIDEELKQNVRRN